MRAGLLATAGLLLLTACPSAVRESPDYRAWLATLPEEGPPPSSTVDFDMEMGILVQTPGEASRAEASAGPAEDARMRGAAEGRLELLDGRRWRCKGLLTLEATGLPLPLRGPGQFQVEAVADGRSLWVVVQPRGGWANAVVSATVFSGVVEIPFEVLEEEMHEDMADWLTYLVDPVDFVRALDEGESFIELVEAGEKEMHWRIEVRTDGDFPGPAGEGLGMTARYALRADRESGFPLRLDAVSEGAIEGVSRYDWTRRDPASWPADRFRFRAPVGRTIHRVTRLEELLHPPAPGADDEDL